MTSSDSKLPWFIVIEDGQPRVRWLALLWMFGIFYVVQFISLLAASWFSGNHWTWSRLGAMVLPFTFVMLYLVHRAYRRRVMGAFDSPPNTQFSLLMLLVAVSIVCLWLSFATRDHQLRLRRHAERQRFEANAKSIVGAGKARSLRR